MPDGPADLPRYPVIELLKQTEEQLDGQLRAIKKTKTVIASGRRKVEKQPGSRKTLEKVISDLEKLRSEASGASASTLSTLIPALRQTLDDLTSNLERKLRHELQQAAADKNLGFGQEAGTLVLGPFALNLDLARESASLTYATLPVAERLPLDVRQIIAVCEQLSDSILLAPEELGRLADDVEEALRVAIVRAGRPLVGAELRAELPAVYREMVFVQQPQAQSLTKSSVREYPLARFIVELKTLIQSDLNMSGNKRLRLETAVIENARNKKKSIFIPHDLSKGYGEGMYYQALVLVPQS